MSASQRKRRARESERRTISAEHRDRMQDAKQARKAGRRATVESMFSADSLAIVSASIRARKGS